MNHSEICQNPNGNGEIQKQFSERTYHAQRDVGEQKYFLPYTRPRPYAEQGLREAVFFDFS